MKAISNTKARDSDQGRSGCAVWWVVLVKGLALSMGSGAILPQPISILNA